MQLIFKAKTHINDVQVTVTVAPPLVVSENFISYSSLGSVSIELWLTLLIDHYWIGSRDTLRVCFSAYSQRYMLVCVCVIVNRSGASGGKCRLLLYEIQYSASQSHCRRLGRIPHNDRCARRDVTPFWCNLYVLNYTVVAQFHWWSQKEVTVSDHRLKNWHGLLQMSCDGLLRRRTASGAFTDQVASSLGHQAHAAREDVDV